MKNKFLKLILFLFIYINFLNLSNASEDFKFNVTEIEITENGNLIVGSKNGKVETNDGYEIIAETFVYNKLTNVLNASGNVKLLDNSTNTITIFSDKATYLKNEEIVFTFGNSKAINNNNTITASNFKFDKIKNILNAEENVKFVDKEKDATIFSDKATYLKNEEIVFTEGKTSAIIEKKYNFDSSNVRYLTNNKELSSVEKSKIKDNDGNIYNLDEFFYQVNDKLLKGKNVNIISKIDEKKIDNYFFSEGFFDFDKKSFLSKRTDIKVHKDIFGNDEQDPRLYGISSYGDEEKTVVKKGVFTSCKINENCTPWSIKSEEITHDKIKKNLIYKNAILKIYDVPILYFPKFFHPDPTVKRRTGFLQPQFNRSQILGSSVYVPYFKTLGIDEDYTFKPTIFEDKYILQNEFRKEGENSSLIADFGLTKGYKSSINDKEKNINHFFLNYKKNLDLKKFSKSQMDLKIQRVNNDTYLKVFQNNLFPSPVMPTDKDLMVTEVNYILDKKDYNFSSGFHIYESLGTQHSDRYQYVLPSYNYSRNLDLENINGAINFYSSGSNTLQDTNNLRSSITNDIEYNSIDYFTKHGFKNNFNLYFKNLNSVGKDDPKYKSSPSLEGMSIFEIGSSLPLIKTSDLKQEILTPKISFRANPGNNMKNYSSSFKTISADNAFSINRLGIGDSFEAGKSITFGIDYKLDYENQTFVSNQNSKESSKDKFLEFKLATVLRDVTEDEIPTSSTIDKKNSNIFGSIDNELYENIKFGYDFSIDNDLNTFEFHSINTELSINNFITEFNYIEERAELGSSHVLSNKTTYSLDENNSFSFSTRRNKQISLTEYYDFSYEYKIDCLTAGIKYNKTFYQDNDLKPSENLFFTITLIPLTTYERRLYEN